MKATETNHQDTKSPRPENLVSSCLGGENNRPLPDGWWWMKLGEVVRRKSSNSKLIKGRLSSAPEAGLFPAYSASGQDVWHSPPEHKGTAIILSAVGARCGKCFLAEGEWSAIANTHIIWPIAEKVDAKFLWYLLNDEKFWMKDQAIQPFVQVGATLQKEIPLPPLAEQKRIAGILKEQMAAVERARRSAEAQLQAAESLPAAYLRAVFNSPEAQAWPKKRLGEIARFKNGINFNREQKGRGILTVDVLNMYSNDIFLKTDSLYRVEIDPKPEYLLEKDTILFVRSSVKREGVGWPALFPGHEEPVTFCGFLIRAKMTTGDVDPHFILYHLRQPSVRDSLVTASGQVAITNIGQEDLARTLIPVPPLADQRRIATQLSGQMASAERLRQALAEQLDAITLLPAALLRRAFRGEL
jgi:type I restriction enzyme S subunit